MMVELWTPEDPRDIQELTAIAMKCMGVDEKDDPTPYVIETLMDKNILVEFLILFCNGKRFH
jgi:hypothetical protein